MPRAAPYQAIFRLRGPSIITLDSPQIPCTNSGRMTTRDFSGSFPSLLGHCCRIPIADTRSMDHAKALSDVNPWRSYDSKSEGHMPEVGFKAYPCC